MRVRFDCCLVQDVGVDRLNSHLMLSLVEDFLCPDLLIEVPLRDTFI
jgi:hypothetical protein